MIPRLFHYIWVGPNPLPERMRRFIEANAALHPDFEHKIWREADVDLSAPFVQRAYNAGRWAFVSDYLRFQILAQHGGIYLDSDMELLRPIHPMLASAGFAGLNRDHTSIYCGIIGAVPHLPLFNRILSAYDALNTEEYPTSPDLFTRCYLACSVPGFHIYPADVFYPVKEGEVADPVRLARAYATHHWAESWRRFVPVRRLLRRIGLMRLYHGFRPATTLIAHVINVPHEFEKGPIPPVSGREGTQS
jgi:Glycosyltransferase sugar-binding region containing DXD motif